MWILRPSFWMFLLDTKFCQNRYGQMALNPVQVLVNWIKSNHSVGASLKMRFHSGIGDMKTKATSH